MISDPANNEVVTKVPKSTQAEMERAVEAAKAAFPVRIFLNKTQSNSVGCLSGKNVLLLKQKVKELSNLSHFCPIPK